MTPEMRTSTRVDFSGSWSSAGSSLLTKKYGLSVFRRGGASAWACAVAGIKVTKQAAAMLAPVIQSQRARLRAGESVGCMVLLQGAVRECTQGSIGSAREAGLKCSGSFVKPA